MEIMGDNPFNILLDEVPVRSTGLKGSFLCDKRSKIVYDKNPLFTLYFNDKQADCVTKMLPTNYPDRKNVREKAFMNVKNTFVSSPPSHSKLARMKRVLILITSGHFSEQNNMKWIRDRMNRETAAIKCTTGHLQVSVLVQF